MDARYPIRAVSKMTGLPIETLRAWERRYGVVEPAREGRGRMYGEEEVRRLLLLKGAVENGHAIGQVAALSEHQLEVLAAAPVPVERAGLLPGVERVLEAIRVLDDARVEEELRRMALLLEPSALVHEVVLPLMHKAGEYWEAGRFEIVHEHLLSASIRNLLGGLMRVKGRAGAPRVVLATLPGEHHEFGILAAAILAVAQGLAVTYLGPNLPAGQVAYAARECGAAAVVLGVMKAKATGAVRTVVAGLKRELPAGTQLWVGGSGAAEVAEEGGGTRVFGSLEAYERALPLLAGVAA